MATFSIAAVIVFVVILIGMAALAERSESQDDKEE